MYFFFTNFKAEFALSTPAEVTEVSRRCIIFTTDVIGNIILHTLLLAIVPERVCKHVRFCIFVLVIHALYCKYLNLLLHFFS